MKTIRLFVTVLLALLCTQVGAAQQQPPRHQFSPTKPSVAPKVPDPHFSLLLDNARVRVSRVEIAPNSETAMLPHPYDYVLVSFGPSNLEVAGESNRFAAAMQDGEMQIIPGKWTHRLINKSSATAHLLMIESRTAIKPDAPICGLAAEPCHDMNFAKDGSSEYIQNTVFETPTIRLVRAELGPQTSLPRHEHGSDHLLLALTKVQLLADSDNVSQDAETAYWHAGGFTTLKNVGQEQARFLLLEVK